MNETSPLEDLVEQKEELIPQLNENRWEKERLKVDTSE
jgi:hypothetical protein